MEQALTFRDPQGHRVSAILTTPPAPTTRVAVLCHGFLSNKNSRTNQTLTAQLIPLGIATFRFDFFGQGESEGPFERITVTLALQQALAALAFVESKGYRQIALEGSSFGGLVATLAAAERPGLACLALKCPVADFPETLQLEFGPDGMAQWKATDTIPDVTGGPGRVRLLYAFYEDCTKYSGYAAAEAITAPTLIVQGDKDQLVPPHQSRRLLDSLRKEKRLELLPGADHEFTRPEDFATLTRLLGDWIAGHVNRPQA